MGGVRENRQVCEFLAVEMNFFLFQALQPEEPSPIAAAIPPHTADNARDWQSEATGFPSDARVFTNLT